MKTFNIRAILKITLVFICTLFYPIYNKAGECIIGIEHGSQFVKKVTDSQSIAKDSICLIKWYNNFSDTLNNLTKSSPSTHENESFLLTDNAKNQNIISDKVSTERKPRKLAYVLIEVLIKRLSLMLNE
ncbi:MAG: hypothetical protein CVU00_11330 [Bacteroidetes bacterium HGW-Bacteroidetes-17]|nr:MAG: hypothetical protein CVU00_11330 [Bacteroidetes bacterium HGW-Bacteroidetes-17]